MSLPRRVCTALMLVTIGAGELSGQLPVPLFTAISSTPLGGDPPIGVLAAYPVVLNLDGLQLAPGAIEVELPSGEIFSALLDVFEPVEGFDESGGPPPGSTIGDLSYVWRGKGVGNEVILAVVGRALSGLITGPSGHFSIGKAQSEDTLFKLAPEQLPGEPPFDSTFRAPESIGIAPRIAASDLPVPVKVLILALYTDQARIDSGGAPADLNDDADIRALTLGASADTNVALENSGVNVTVKVAHIARLDGFVPTGNSGQDLTTLRDDATIQSMRDQFEADVVSVILRSTESSLVFFCGTAVLQSLVCGQSPETAGCDVGDAFSPFAYNWSAQNCARANFTFAHELGHNLGCNHNPEGGALPPDQAAFPFSFGHVVRTPNAFYRTVMGIDAAPRRLYFSNPAVLLDDEPTGLVGERDNALTIDLLAPAASAFRGPAPFIFLDGFEAGDTSRWSTACVACDPDEIP